MTAYVLPERSEQLSCLQSKEIRFSFVIEETPRRFTLAPASYYLQEFRKAMRIHLHNYENDFEDHDE